VPIQKVLLGLPSILTPNPNLISRADQQKEVSSKRQTAIQNTVITWAETDDDDIEVVYVR
jgi:hypothetical protein